MSSTLELREISKSFRGSSQPAVNEVSLEVEAGELVSILGPSGCGKTTLLRIVTGFLRADRGSVLIDGKDVTRVPPHQRDIGMVYQSYALWPHMTVAANVAFGLEMRRVPRDERKRRVEEILELVGLTSLASRHPAQLSGGQQQRVALARALVVRPQLLLLDEPLASLDAHLRLQLRFYIRELQQQLKVSTVFVTHDQEEALAVSDRLILMRDGVIVESAAGESLYTTPDGEYAMTFIGEANLFEGVVRTIVGEEVIVATVLGDIGCSRPEVLPLKEGDEVRVGVRPDHIRLEACENGAGERLDAPVGELQSRVFLGPWARYNVRIGETDLTVRLQSTPDTRGLEAGEKVRVSVIEGCARVLVRDGVASKAVRLSGRSDDEDDEVVGTAGGGSEIGADPAGESLGEG